MKNSYYVPIFEWGGNPNEINGVTSGCQIYQSLQDLYGFNPEAVGYFEVSGTVPTKEEFEAQQKEQYK